MPQGIRNYRQSASKRIYHPLFFYLFFFQNKISVSESKIETQTAHI